MQDDESLRNSDVERARRVNEQVQHMRRRLGADNVWHRRHPHIARYVVVAACLAVLVGGFYLYQMSYH